MSQVTEPLTRRPHLATIIFLAAASVMTLNLFLPAMADIADDLGVSESQISWALSGYMIVTALLQLVIGPLSDRFGRRPLALACFTIFVVASFVAAFAPNPTLFFIGRFVQAAVIGGMVLSQAIVRDVSDGQKDAAGMLATVSMVMALGPMLAPAIGGFLSEVFGWRSNFFFLAAYGSFVLALCWWNLFETNLTPNKTFGTQFRAYPALIFSSRFWHYASCNAFAGGMFYVFILAVPLVGRAEPFDLSNGQIGMCMAALPMGYIMGNFLVRSKSKAWGISAFLVMGRILCVVAPLATLVAFMLGFQNLWACLPIILVGTANAFSIPTSVAGVVSINTKLAGSAGGLMASFTLMMGAFISTLTAYVLEGNPTVEMMCVILLAVAGLGIPSTYAIWRAR